MANHIILNERLILHDCCLERWIYESPTHSGFGGGRETFGGYEHPKFSCISHNLTMSMSERQGWEVTVHHCYREANCAADWLANYGVNMEQHLLIFEAIPVDFRSVFLEDLGGMTIDSRVPAPTA